MTYLIKCWVNALGVTNILIYVRDINGNNINRAFQPNQVHKIPSQPHQQGPDIQHGPQEQPARLPPTTSRRNAHHIMGFI